MTKCFSLNGFISCKIVYSKRYMHLGVIFLKKVWIFQKILILLPKIRIFTDFDYQKVGLRYEPFQGAKWPQIWTLFREVSNFSPYDCNRDLHGQKVSILKQKLTKNSKKGLRRLGLKHPIHVKQKMEHWFHDSLF